MFGVSYLAIADSDGTNLEIVAPSAGVMFCLVNISRFNTAKQYSGLH